MYQSQKIRGWRIGKIDERGARKKWNNRSAMRGSSRDIEQSNRLRLFIFGVDRSGKSPAINPPPKKNEVESSKPVAR